MLRNSFKQLAKSILAVFLGFAFSTNAFAGGIIEGNDSFNKAYSIGSWEYHESLIGKLATDTDEAYFTFTANKDDKVSVKTWNGLSIEIFNNYQQPVAHSDEVEYPTTFPYANVDATSSYQTFYIKINRTTATGDAYYILNINNRIATVTSTFDFIGTAYNQGNPDYQSNPSGIDSNIVSMDLTEDSSIPVNAVIKSITTSSDIDTSLSGVYHKVYSTLKDTWYQSIVGSPESGFYDIDLSSELKVSQLWNFKYNFAGTSSSSMDNIKATIKYEYDVTEQY